MDRLTLWTLIAALACSLMLALWAMHMATDTHHRLRSVEHIVFGTEPTV